jgi:hypothetical protein
VGPIGVAVAVIGHNPDDPLHLEALLSPFEGSDDRCYHSPTIRYLLRSWSTPVVLIDPNSKILLATEASVPKDRLEKMAEMERDFLNVKPVILAQSQLLAAIQHNQSKVPLGQFGLE